jgi:hypothetical protein
MRSVNDIMNQSPRSNSSTMTSNLNDQMCYNNLVCQMLARRSDTQSREDSNKQLQRIEIVLEGIEHNGRIDR